MFLKIFLTGLVLSTLNISFSQEIKKQKIEVEKTSTTTSQTDVATGTTKTTGFGFKYQWRYVGEEKWNSVGRRRKNIAPILQQYPNSAKLFKQSRLIYGVGKPVSILLIGGGMVMGGIGYINQVDYEEIYTDPTTNEDKKIVHYNKGYRTLKFMGIAAFGVGFTAYYASFYLGVKKFDQSIVRYNRMVDKETETASVNRYQINLGLQLSPNSNFPLMSFRINL